MTNELRERLTNRVKRTTSGILTDGEVDLLMEDIANMVDAAVGDAIAEGTDMRSILDAVGLEIRGKSV